MMLDGNQSNEESKYMHISATIKNYYYWFGTLLRIEGVMNYVGI